MEMFPGEGLAETDEHAGAPHAGSTDAPEALAPGRAIPYSGRSENARPPRGESDGAAEGGGPMTPFRLTAEQRRYFCVLCSVGNITRAAEQLYLSRQGLSRSMARLEEQMGVRLFARGKGGVVPTEAGRALLRRLHEEDRAWEELLDELHRREGQSPEIVRVGLMSMYVGYDEKRRLLARFEGDAGLRLEIVHGDHDGFWDAIAAGQMACAVTLRPPECRDLPSIRLTDDSLSVVLSRDDGLARRRRIDFCDLRGKTVLQPSPYKGRLYETVLRNHGLVCEPVCPDRNLVLAHISARREYLLIQEEFARALENDEVCSRPVDRAPIAMSSHLVFRPDMSERERAVARVIADSCGKAGELDAFFGD